MARPIHPIRPLLVAVLAALTACGGDGAGDRPTSIEEALGMPDEEDFQQRERAVQDAIRECMAAEGFEYIPVDVSGAGIRIARPGDRPDPEFRAQFGYGVTTNLDRELDGNAPDDPNAEIRDSLSESDREAYDRALHGRLAEQFDGGEVNIRIGPGGRISGGEDGEEITPEDAGCFGQAQASVRDEAFDPEVGRQLMDMEQRIESDPRMVEATRAWSSCMRDAGFDYASPRDIVDALMERLEALRGPDDENGNPTGDEAGLARLQDEERATARADDECWDEHLREVEAEVRAEYEDELLDELAER